MKAVQIAALVMLCMITGVDGRTLGLWHFDDDVKDCLVEGGRLKYWPASEFSTTTVKVGSHAFFASENCSNVAPGIIALADGVDLDGDSTFGISFWVYRTTPVTDWRAMFSFGLSGMRIRHYGGASDDWFYLSNAGFVDVGDCWDHKIAIPQNTWTHIAITADGAMGRVYVNNQLASYNEWSQTGNGLNAGPEIFLGNIDDWQPAMGCYFDELIICDDACGDDWVDAVYNATDNGENMADQSGPVSIWHFENAGLDSMESEGTMTYSSPSGFSNTVRKVGGYSFHADETASVASPGIINLTGKAVINGDETFGIAFWVYRTTDVTGWEALFSFGNNGMRIRHYGGASLDWYYLSNPGFVNLGNPWEQRITLPINTWTHVAITADGQEGRVFVNNQLASFNHANQTGAGLLAGDKIFLGNLDNWEPTVGCYIDELVINNATCDAEWVDSVYNASISGVNLMCPGNCQEAKYMGQLLDGDVNNDCLVDSADMAYLLDHWLESNDPNE